MAAPVLVRQDADRQPHNRTGKNRYTQQPADLGLAKSKLLVVHQKGDQDAIHDPAGKARRKSNGAHRQRHHGSTLLHLHIPSVS